MLPLSSVGDEGRRLFVLGSSDSGPRRPASTALFRHRAAGPSLTHGHMAYQERVYSCTSVRLLVGLYDYWYWSLETT